MRGLLSALLAVIGITLMMWYHHIHAEAIVDYLAHSQSNETIESESIPDNFPGELLFKVNAIILGVISFIFGFIAARKRSKIGYVGFALSIVLFLLVLIPIWKLFVGDLAVNAPGL